MYRLLFKVYNMHISIWLYAVTETDPIISNRFSASWIVVHFISALSINSFLLRM